LVDLNQLSWHGLCWITLTINRGIPRLTVPSKKRSGGMVRWLPPNVSEPGGGRHDRPDSTGLQTPAEARADIPSITLAVSHSHGRSPRELLSMTGAGAEHQAGVMNTSSWGRSDSPAW